MSLILQIGLYFEVLEPNKWLYEYHLSFICFEHLRILKLGCVKVVFFLQKLGA